MMLGWFSVLSFQSWHIQKTWKLVPSTLTQHIPTLLAQHLEPPEKRSQHLNPTDRNIVGRNILHAFGHPVATCWEMLRAENRTTALAQAQHCWTDLAKGLQHHATSTNVAWQNWTIFKFETIPKISQQVVLGWLNARSMLHPTISTTHRTENIWVDKTANFENS